MLKTMFYLVSYAKVIKKQFPTSFSSRFNNLREYGKTDTSLCRIRFYKKKGGEYTFFSYFCTKFPRIMKNEPIYNLLNTINYPDDLRRLDVEQLPEVCSELRQDIIKELCCNPGAFCCQSGNSGADRSFTLRLQYTL